MEPEQIPVDQSIIHGIILAGTLIIRHDLDWMFNYVLSRERLAFACIGS
jgi:hypothetical protein